MTATRDAGGVLLASMGYALVQGKPGVHEMLIVLFLFVTAPASVNLMARAAPQLRVRSRAPVPPDQLSA